MKLNIGGKTTIISALVFTILGIILIDINRTFSYGSFAVGIIIEVLGVLGEIQSENK